MQTDPNMMMPMETKRPQRWALLGALILAALPLILVGSQLRRSALFPRAEERFDITQMWVATASDLCPELTASVEASQLESCLARQTLDTGGRSAALRSFQLPPLDEMPLQTYPLLENILEKHGYLPEVTALKSQQLLLLGFKVPRSLFQENAIGVSPNVLVTAQLTDSRICYAGVCPHSAENSNYLGLQFPLFIPSGKALPEQVDVWIALKPTASLSTINLEHALFVTNIQKMRSVNLVHRPIILGSWMIGSALLFGVVVMAMLYAVLWSEYIDFTAFAVMVDFLLISALEGFCASFFSRSVVSKAVILGIDYMVSVELVLASVFFAIATLRPRPVRFWLTWLGLGIVLGACFTWVGIHDGTRSLDDMVTITLDSMRAFLPAAIALVGGFAIRRRLNREKQLFLEHQVAGKRRQREQLIMAVCLFVAGVPDLLAGIFQCYGNYTYDLRTLDGIVILPVFAALLYSASGKFRSRAEQYRHDLVSMTKKAAVGEMAQLLAHDVRKPFSMLRMGLDMLSRANDQEEIRSIMGSLISQVSKSIRTVSVMVEDVMDVSSEPVLIKESVTIESLIAQCLQDVFSSRPDTDVTLEYNLAANAGLIDVDSARLLRVIANIVENAIQATHGRCRIWFNARLLTDKNGAQVELIIGNSGSFIAPDKCEQIFEAFYSAGKAGGVGLGLAVARKFVDLHGGCIRCRSDQQKGTEFVLILPSGQGNAAAEHPDLPLKLPTHSTQVIDPLSAAGSCMRGNWGDTPLTPEETALRQEIWQEVARLKRPLRIMLVDDEPIYTAAMSYLMQCLGDKNSEQHKIHEIVTVKIAENAKAALAHVAEERIDLGIFDIDLGDPTTDGLQLMASMLQSRAVHSGCVHSNRSLPADCKRAMAAGAQNVMPKPMSRMNLLKLIGGVAALIPQSYEPGPPAVKAAVANPGGSFVVVIDDCIFTRESWQRVLRASGCLTFGSAGELVQWLESKPSELRQLLCMIVDYYLDDDVDGLELAGIIHQHLAIPVLLSTDAYLNKNEMDLSMITAIIPKTPVPVEELRRVLAALGAADQLAV